MDFLHVHVDDGRHKVICQKNFVAGEIIGEIPVIDVHQKPTPRTVWGGENNHYDLGILSNINHSCKPNIIIHIAQMVIQAVQDIDSGDEITYFYPSTDWILECPFICSCTHPQCIKYVAGARFLPLYLLEQYHINEHVIQMVKRLVMINEHQFAYA